MTERGVVSKVKGKYATVQFDRRSACDACHMCSVTKDNKKVEVYLENTLGAKVGQFVEVAMGEKYVLSAAVIVYVIPLILCGIGLGVGTIISELASILMAIGGLVLGFVIAFILEKKVIKKKTGFKPVMKAICPENAEGYKKDEQKN